MFKKLRDSAPCWCKSGKCYGECHKEYDRMLSGLKQARKKIPPRKIIKNETQIQGIRESSKINIAVLDYVGEHIKIGMSTEEINTLVYDKTVEMGGIPAPLNYDGFPKSVCTSIGSQVCHGIPAEDEFLEDGDIINVDVSTIYKGYFSDSSRMFMLGNVHPEVKRLVEVTKESINVGLEQVVPWKPIGNVGAAINEFAQKNGYTVVREIGGHGVGLEFHEEPFVSFVSKWDTGMIMAPGMVFTIEPMINMGGPDIFIDADNDWTVYTDDGMPSAQWEVTVLVTEEGYEILTY
ncbi:MAG: methionyl aminopeptidase [Alistipes sp.]|nr:methionyl aminopeptidase [Alistipes sp.]